MGLFGSGDAPARRQDDPVQDDGALESVANAFIGKLLDVGIDGIGPVDSSSEVVRKARRERDDDEKVIDKIVTDHIKKASVGGFLTGVGGITTMPVALPANVVEFYTLATRMVAGMAEVRGYDVSTKETRTAIVLSLVGADADDLIRRAGLTSIAGMSGSGRLARLATSRMPRAAGMMVNKAVGFRLLTNVGGRALGRFVRFVPLAGGLVGAGLDSVLMKRLADHARREFAPVEPNVLELEPGIPS